MVHDLFYNVNLKSITVGDRPPIPVSAPTKASGNVSNSIVDSGTNGIYLDAPVFKEVLAQFSSLGLEDAVRAGYVPMSKLNFAEWPTLTFVLEGRAWPRCHSTGRAAYVLADQFSKGWPCFGGSLRRR